MMLATEGCDASTRQQRQARRVTRYDGMSFAKFPKDAPLTTLGNKEDLQITKCGARAENLFRNAQAPACMRQDHIVRHINELIARGTLPASAATNELTGAQMLTVVSHALGKVNWDKISTVGIVPCPDTNYGNALPLPHVAGIELVVEQPGLAGTSVLGGSSKRSATSIDDDDDLDIKATGTAWFDHLLAQSATDELAIVKRPEERVQMSIVAHEMHAQPSTEHPAGLTQLEQDGMTKMPTLAFYNSAPFKANHKWIETLFAGDKKDTIKQFLRSVGHLTTYATDNVEGALDKDVNHMTKAIRFLCHVKRLGLDDAFIQRNKLTKAQIMQMIYELHTTTKKLIAKAGMKMDFNEFLIHNEFYACKRSAYHYWQLNSIDTVTCDGDVNARDHARGVMLFIKYHELYNGLTTGAKNQLGMPVPAADGTRLSKKAKTSPFAQGPHESGASDSDSD